MYPKHKKIEAMQFLALKKLKEYLILKIKIKILSDQ